MWLISEVEMKLVGKELGDISRDQTTKGLVDLEHFFYNLAIRSQESGDSGVISGCCF